MSASFEQHQPMTFRFLAIVPPFSLRSMNPGPHTPIYARIQPDTNTLARSLCLNQGTKNAAACRNEPGKYGSVSDRTTSSTKETGRTRRETPQYFVHTHKCVCTVRREVLAMQCFAHRRRDLYGPQSNAGVGRLRSAVLVRA